jgi:hypothetical protein
VCVTNINNGALKIILKQKNRKTKAKAIENPKLTTYSFLFPFPI